MTPLNIEHEKADPEFGKKMPVIVYYHGGGFAVCCPNFRIYDVYCRRLAQRCGALVLSVHYRQVMHLSNAPFSFIADHCFPSCKLEIRKLILKKEKKRKYDVTTCSFYVTHLADVVESIYSTLLELENFNFSKHQCLHV